MLLYYSKALFCYSCPEASQLVAHHYRVDFPSSEHRVFGMRGLNGSRVYCERGSFWPYTKLICGWAPFQKHSLWCNRFDGLEKWSFRLGFQYLHEWRNSSIKLTQETISHCPWPALFWRKEKLSQWLIVLCHRELSLHHLFPSIKAVYC